MFIGRQAELQRLRALVTEPSSIAVIYGRRRIGKSELIREAFKGQKIFSFEGLENQSSRSQLKHFLLQLKDFKVEPQEDAANWQEAFMQLTPLLAKERTAVVVLDEFQWMANYRNEIVAVLKFIWDRYWSKLKTKIALVLCGSIASYMINKVVRSKALYGRADTVIHLQQLKPHEVRLLLPHLGQEELFLAMLLFGGIPKYLNLLKDQPSIILAIQKLAFTPDSYFQHEFERIFVSHFGSKKHYQQIVKLLATHHHGLTRQQLIKLTKITAGGRVSESLFNLESAGFIKPYAPFNKKGSTKYTRYVLSDPYLRFYFAFIEPNLKKSTVRPELFQAISQSSAFQSWLGIAFEQWCIEHARLLASILEFAAVDYTVGPFWGQFQSSSKQITPYQIDLIFDRADNVVTLCEVKYRNSLAVSTLFREVDRKVEALRSEVGSKSIQKVLITKSNPTPALSDYFYRIVTCKQLLEHSVALKL